MLSIVEIKENIDLDIKYVVYSTFLIALKFL